MTGKTKIQEFMDSQRTALADAQRALRVRARTGVLRTDLLHPADRAVVEGKIWADAIAAPNDYAIETLARMVVRDSRALQDAGWREDAGETALFAQALKHVIATATPTLYMPNKVRSTFPVDASIPPGASTVAVRRYEDKDDDDFGQLSPLGDDIIEVTLQGTEDIYKLATFARAFSWTLDELEAAAFANMPLQTEGLNALNRAVERIFELVSLRGFAPAGFTGLYNDAHIPLTVPVTGTWTAPATHDQIVGDIRALVEAVYQANRNVRPNRLVVPADRWRYLATRRGNTDLNVLGALKQDYPDMQVVEASPRADDYDAAGTGPRMMAFYYDPAMLSVVEARRFTLEAPERHGFKYRVAGRQKLGGARVSVPLSAGYMDGI